MIKRAYDTIPPPAGLDPYFCPAFQSNHLGYAEIYANRKEAKV